MCGVFAFLGRDSDKLHLATQMAMMMGHRGIRTKIVRNEVGVMGHIRLPIVGIDEDNDQPYQDSRYTLGFVGEVLDFREHEPTMQCDTDMVVRKLLYDEEANGLAGHDGFWGVIIMDNKTKSMGVVTDYLAQKPMYYRADFPSAASEIEPLRLMGKCTFDEVYFAAVIKWGYCPDTTRTPWNEIKHLLPGERVILNASGLMDRRIVDPLVPRYGDSVAIKGAIEDAVKRRVLSSDVPVGILLSGGLDSSIVYTLATRHGEVSAYFAKTNAHEVEVRNVTKLTDGNYGIIDWNRVSTAEALEVMQEPIDLGSLRPQISLAMAVDETVCLTGDGADELFGGYGRALRYDSQMSDIYQELVAWHLPRLDRVMMRYQIETRSPFLARDVVEMAMGLPYSKRINKDVLRAMFKDDLPPGMEATPKIPLRTHEVANDREAYSQSLVTLFKGQHTHG